MKPYKTLKNYSCDEIIINKSTFIGYGKNIISQSDAEDFIKTIKKNTMMLLIIVMLIYWVVICP